MEEPNASRNDAAMFALMALVARLITTQSSTLKIWYSRRCYERSRGEMITMIFQKTLARKIVGAPKKPKQTEHDNGVVDGPIAKIASSPYHPYQLWTKAREQLKRLFSSNPGLENAKEPASMGKILNLMR